jgi:hypothetical protein
MYKKQKAQCITDGEAWQRNICFALAKIGNEPRNKQSAYRLGAN